MHGRIEHGFHLSTSRGAIGRALTTALDSGIGMALSFHPRRMAADYRRVPCASAWSAWARARWLLTEPKEITSAL